MTNTPSPLAGYKAQLRDLERQMKRDGIRVISCFNGGLSFDESRCNTEIFRLKTALL